MATVDADGTTTIIVPNGPFGESLSGHSSPQNSASGTSNDYLSIHRKSTESEYLIQPIQMGGRVYIPELGRFLQIDPADGGTLNGYVYALDPINQVDADGNWIFIAVMAVVAIVSVVMAAKSVHTAVKNPTPTNITVAVIDTAGAAGAAFTGGGSVVASRTASAAASAAARGTANASARKAAQIAANKAAGKEAERVALEKAKTQYAKEYELRTQQYFKIDGYDRGRFADISAYKNNQPIFNIEVKSGNAKYGGLQASKDQAILDQYGVPTYVERIMLTGK